MRAIGRSREASGRGELATLNVASVRSRVANGYLIAFCALAVPALGASLFRTVDIGWQPIMTLHLCAAVAVFAVTLLRRRLPYLARAGFLIGLLCLLGLAGLMSFGLVSGATLFLLSASVLAFLLCGSLGGWITAGVSGLVMVVAYAVHGSAPLSFGFDLTAYASSLSVWVGEAVGLALMISALGVGVTAFNRQLLDAWRHADRERSELALLSDQLKAARDEAVAASRAKSEFLANASHELRTPLNAIIGFSEYLLIFGASTTPERRSEYLNDIHRSGKHLLAVVNDLLDLSRVEANRYELEETDFDLNELVDEAVRMSRPLATAAKVRLSVVGPIKPITLHADRRTLYQVLFNLLSNAIKFNRSPGTAEVRAARRADGAVEIVVSDTGIGVDPAVIPELFRPFRQANSEIARQFGGTGLGLSIVERLVKLHGGEVRMESEPGHGTSVTVTLPAARVVTPSRMAVLPLPQPAKRRA